MPPEESEKLLEYVVKIGAAQPDVAEADREHQRKVTECADYLRQSRDKWMSIKCLDEGGQLRSREDIHEELFQIVRDHM